MTLDSIPVVFIDDGKATWMSQAFASLSKEQQDACLSQARIVSNTLVTEVLLADSIFQSVAVVPVGESQRILVFSKQENSDGLPSSSIELLSLLVHDLRSPITSIYGFAETIIESGSTFSQDEIMVFLRKIRGAALRANVLLSNMQALASGVRATSKARKFQVNSLIKEVIDGMWLEPGAKLSIHLENQSTEVELDYIAVERIVGNLLNNAAKFCAKDGEIRVKTSRVDGGVQVTIFNSGDEILPNELPFIFEKFKRGSTSRGKPGSGLGLFIAQHLAKQIGASLGVESSQAGTQFSVFLPT
jgi:signal transduction histidine kinase